MFINGLLYVFYLFNAYTNMQIRTGFFVFIEGFPVMLLLPPSSQEPVPATTEAGIWLGLLTLWLFNCGKWSIDR